mmetsp:Transcript_2719/g.4579  ORF Transcript_2719/g.4579 Transcript_2719/m.4579 type:complete len:200 (-) Transcript_2719:161-760(-)
MSSSSLPPSFASTSRASSSSRRCKDAAPCLLALTMVGNSELFSSTKVSPKTHTTAMPSSAYSLLRSILPGALYIPGVYAFVSPFCAFTTSMSSFSRMASNLSIRSCNSKTSTLGVVFPKAKAALGCNKSNVGAAKSVAAASAIPSRGRGRRVYEELSEDVPLSCSEREAHRAPIIRSGVLYGFLLTGPRGDPILEPLVV